jgi:hypothetical protein
MVKMNVVVFLMNLNLLRTKTTPYINSRYKRTMRGNSSITLLNIVPLQSTEAREGSSKTEYT